MLYKKRISIGYCSAGDLKGFPANYLNQIKKEGADALKDLGFEIFEFPNILSDYKTAHESIDYFEKNKVRIVVINIAGWIEPGITLKIMRSLNNVFFVFWAFGSFNQTLTLTGLIENTSTIVKMGIKNFCTLIGSPEKQEVKKMISSKLKVVSLFKSLESLDIGIIGSNCPGMVDTTFNEISLRKRIGCNLKHLDLTELLSIYNKIPGSDLLEEANLIESSFKCISISKNDVLLNVKLYRAFKKIVEEYSLDAFAIRCWPELKNNTLGYNVTPCFALSKLSDEGVIGSCEADVSSAVTMLILQRLTGNPPVSLDYNTIDTNRNSLTLWHCGANARSLANSDNDISIRRPTSGGLEMNCGMSVEFPIKEGEAVLAKLNIEFDKVIIATGKTVIPQPIYRGGICEFMLDVNVQDYVERIVMEGMEHHVCAVHGNVKNELVQLAKLLDISCISF